MRFAGTPPAAVFGSTGLIEDAGRGVGVGPAGGVPSAALTSAAIVRSSTDPLPARPYGAASGPAGRRPAEKVATMSVAIPAAARFRPDRKPMNRPCLNGSSMKRWLSAATPTARPARANRAGHGNGASRAAAGMTRIGQCQRYSE